jgi:hydrophobic/amphiphilic exporter-1 (mainly G- bacteria), HAE1 family
MKPARFAVTKPVTMSMILICVTVLGIISGLRVPINQNPEVERPALFVRVSVDSGAPKEILRAVTIPLEDILSTTAGLERMITRSTPASSGAFMQFESGTDIDLVSMEVRDKLDLVVQEMPDDLRRIGIHRYRPNDDPVLEAHVSWDGDTRELFDLVYYRLYRRLRRIEGVADVDIRGISGREVMISLDQNLLQAHGADLYSLSRDIAANNRNLSAGYVMSGGRKYSVRSIGEYKRLEEIAATQIPGTEVLLDDLGDVELSEPYGHWWDRLNGSDAISLAVTRDYTANLMQVASAVRQELADFQAEPGMENLSLNVYRDQSVDITRSILGLLQAGLLGMLFACIVLYGFLRKVRSTLIILTAIPVSMISAFLFMYIAREMFHSLVSVNLVSLVGLMISVGMLLDNGVVVLENIFRHRQEHQGDAQAAAIAGSEEVAIPVVAATLTTLIVFVPMFFVSDSMMSTTMKDFGIVVCVALIASLCVAFTLIPLLASRLFRNVQRQPLNSLQTLSRWYKRILLFSLRHRFLMVLSTVSVVAVSGWLFTKVERELEPQAPRRSLSLLVEHPTSYTEEEMLALFGSVESTLLARKEELDIKHITSSFGLAYQTHGIHRRGSYLWIGLKDIEDSRTSSTVDAIENIMDTLPKLPGVTFRRKSSARSKESGQIFGMEISGHDVDLLSVYADEIKMRISDIPDVVDIETSLERGQEEVTLHVHRDKAQKVGVTSRQIARTLQFALGTRTASFFKTDEGERRITIRLQEEDRATLEELDNMVLENQRGEMVSLSSVSNYTKSTSPQEIVRKDRRTIVEIFVHTRKAGRQWVQKEIYERLKDMNLPMGYSLDIPGTGERREMELDTLFSALLALVLIYMVLAALFESIIHPLTILLSVPFAMIGVLLTFIALSITLNSMSYLGIIILLGIVVNNGIILVSYIMRQMDAGTPRREAIVLAGLTRLRPILMTASTTILGILPLILPLIFPNLFTASGDAKIYGPIAAAVAGGLLTSTILTLVITPTLFSLIDDFWLWLQRVLKAVAS